MKLTVKLFASFQHGRFKQEVREYPEQTRIATVIDEQKIPIDEIGILLLNSVHASPEKVLQDGDVLAIFPLVGGG
jgi:molybdopterin converting factor small subunit